MRNYSLLYIVLEPGQIKPLLQLGCWQESYLQMEILYDINVTLVARLHWANTFLFFKEIWN